MLRLLLRPQVRSVLFDLLLCAGVVGLASLQIFERENPRPTMLLGYVMAVAILARRYRPLSVMAVVATAALWQVILFEPKYDPLPYDLAVLVAMYSVVKYGRRMFDAYLAAATVATGIVIEVVRHPNVPTVPLALWYVGVCGGVWLMAYTMRTRRLYVVGLEERAATLEREREHLARIAVADERATIARELHDVVAHSLAVMIVQADGGRYAFDSEPDKARAALETVARTGREALADMGRLVSVLRGTDTAEPEPADDRRRIGLEQLEALADRARTAGLTVRVNCPGWADGLPAAAELAIFRLTQEALTNVLRHAGPDASVTVDVECDEDAVRLSIVDDGAGRPEVPAPAQGGHGLVGMRERVAAHGGIFTAGPRTDGGWAVEARLPVGVRAVEAVAI